jgi:hypothetical protein
VTDSGNDAWPRQVGAPDPKVSFFPGNKAAAQIPPKSLSRLKSYQPGEYGAALREEHGVRAGAARAAAIEEVRAAKAAAAAEEDYLEAARLKAELDRMVRPGRSRAVARVVRDAVGVI